jgi:hypothetical protein
MKKFGRHGDVIVLTHDKFTKIFGEFNVSEGKKVNPKNGKFILALGEATGHHHEAQVCERDEMVEFEKLFGIEGAKVMTLEKETELVHVGSDHNTITLPAGVSVAYQQREYTPEKVRRVID